MSNQLTNDEIEHQQRLLAIYRNNLRLYRVQLGAFGNIAYAPPVIIFSSQKALEDIARIKLMLNDTTRDVETDRFWDNLKDL